MWTAVSLVLTDVPCSPPPVSFSQHNCGPGGGFVATGSRFDVSLLDRVRNLDDNPYIRTRADSWLETTTLLVQSCEQ